MAQKLLLSQQPSLSEAHGCPSKRSTWHRPWGDKESRSPPGDQRVTVASSAPAPAQARFQDSAQRLLQVWPLEKEPVCRSSQGRWAAGPEEAGQGCSPKKPAAPAPRHCSLWAVCKQQFVFGWGFASEG